MCHCIVSYSDAIVMEESDASVFRIQFFSPENRKKQISLKYWHLHTAFTWRHIPEDHDVSIHLFKKQ
jgi:hypothetical protein